MNNKKSWKGVIKKESSPTKMKIGFREYNVRAAPLKERKDRRYNGASIIEQNEIRLRTDVSNDEIKATIFHEFFHSYIYDLGLNLGLKGAEEEKMCQLFSAAVMQLVRDPDNWKVLEWAREKGNDSHLKEIEVD